MRKAIFILVLGLMISCSERETLSPASVNVEFVAGMRTKGGFKEGETAVRSIDVFLFRRNDGSLDSSVHGDGNTVSVSVTKGVALEYWVIANAPAGGLAGISDKHSFCETVSDLTDNTPEHLVMVGSGMSVFNGGEDTQVDVRRIVSKVTLKRITPSFMKSADYDDVSVSLDRIYLINVSRSCGYGLVPLGIDWCNTLSVDEALSPFLKRCLVLDLDKSITDDSPIDVDAVFYCYPNPIDNGITSVLSPDWSVRNTRLVVETTIRGVKNYYPVTMPAMQCNNEYRINTLEMKGEGSENPDIPVNRKYLEFGEISIVEWGTVDKMIDIE